jgi:K+-sensing histidine kinase KdpD
LKNTKYIKIVVDSIGKKLYVQIGEFLDDVFDNILNNAKIYNKNPMVKITIRISRYEKNNTKYFKIEFMDNGRGIDDNRKKIVFQRGNAKKGSTQGMGLGLSLVNNIVASNNGEIWVEDRIKGDYAKGSNVVLLLPEVI